MKSAVLSSPLSVKLKIGSFVSERNKALARRFYEEVFNKRNMNTIDEFCATDIVDHSAMPEQAKGPKSVKNWFNMFLMC